MKIGAVSLGCDKNRVDTENLLGFASRAGHIIVNDYDDADAVIVNTCSFLQSAVKESLDAVFEARARGNVKYVILAGCLPMRYFKEVSAEDGLSEVDAILPNTTYHRIGEVLDRLEKGERVILSGDESMPKQSFDRVITTPYHYAYLKIAEGCDNRCTFCAIPSIRGKYRSETKENLVKEASDLVSQGVKELILVAQDVTRYGTDRSGASELLDLLKALVALPLERIRLLYCYPDMCTDALIDYIDNEPKMAKYIDMPMQHASDAVLKRMNRRDTMLSLKNRVAYIRSKASGIAIRSTFMVGFPGETDTDFETLCRFLEEERLDQVGFFAYSREEGTPAAKLKEQIPHKEKQRRLSVVRALQSRIAEEKARAMIGKKIKVIYDGIDYAKELFYGHTDKTMPDGDAKVYFTSDFVTEVGETYDVLIEKTKKLDLYGKCVEEEE
ncbi:MAG: 30S ribosomal protein S12 methylthiotransferase RimO [Clostridia bacterium]|nr:30S ribosomal protein S12 methylthiotransferase RimO [Clostridia bacterium]